MVRILFAVADVVKLGVGVGLCVSSAWAGLTLTSPVEYQVVQRSSRAGGVVQLEGVLTGVAGSSVVIKARLSAPEETAEWRTLAARVTSNSFTAALEAPAGGWRRLEVRALDGETLVGEAVVDHVGVGEVFVVAGQSNSANHGEEKQKPTTGRVATFDGTTWRLADDPQPGASGEGGSFLPPFGDALVERFNVPVGIVSCGVGATSVREWLPEGSKFPHPPTLEGNVRPAPGGGWESTGRIFRSFVARLKSLSPSGFRAVLWHQGESDANQKDPVRTLPGPLYREHLEMLIVESRRVIGRKAPWFVAQVSYHVPGDEASPDIRAAQASLWKDGLAEEGPDSDALTGEMREAGGQGVHFSGTGLRAHAARWVEKVAPWLDDQLSVSSGAPQKGRS
ncbi:MAG: sialate O-acetylesterase [Verrucomicrobiales bacterium]